MSLSTRSSDYVVIDFLIGINLESVKRTVDLTTIELLSLLLLLVVSLVVATVIIQMSISKKRKTVDESRPHFNGDSPLPKNKPLVEKTPPSVEKVDEPEFNIEGEEFEVTVIDEPTNRLVTLNVKPYHTVGSLLDTLIDGLDLPKEKPYAFVFDGKRLDEAAYDMTLLNCGISQGKELVLTY